MMTLRPFKMDDLRKLKPQSRHAPHKHVILSKPEEFSYMEGPDSYTLEEGDKIRCCVGMYNGGWIWAFMADDIGSAGLLRATKMIKQKMIEKRRVYFATALYEQGIRWVKLLGFRHLRGNNWICAPFMNQPH